jgi:hypothetical protein
MHIPEDWVENPPHDVESQVFILETHGHDIKRRGPKGDTLRYIFNECKKVYRDALDTLKQNEPQAFFKPSYEQALLLNSWVFGYNFPICFSANRIGKTTAFVFNGILWIYPNNPQWLCFQPYTDHLNRRVEVLPRPSLANILQLQRFYQEYPELVGNPYHNPTEDCNVAKFQKVVELTGPLLNPAWPYPPMLRGGQIWLGAPDNEFHKRIIMRRWRDYLPRSSILKDSESDRMFAVTTASSTNPKTTAHEIVCKSYESEETKWSGDAVQGIILTEGFTADILDEIKNRVTNEGFASWDYTPAEPRNSGRKTALAYKIYKGEEQLPLRSYVFTKFSVRTSPEHIIPREKREDLIRMWENRPEGKARLEGDFFSSSGLVLDKLDRDFHCLNWSLQELFARFPNGRFFRAIDPGLDHPTSCAWGYLSSSNIWFVYRFYSKRGATISQRCEDIITLSNNRREKAVSRGGQVFWREVHPNPNSEVFQLTAADYHIFKRDEVSGNDFALNYHSNGLIITESTHMRPEARATLVNNLLDPNNARYLAHPRTQVAPGARIFFLTSQPGVAEALDKFDQLFWDRFKSGENAGQPKDKVPTHGDDELDALSYLVCGGYVWTRNEPRRRDPQEVVSVEQGILATLQLEQAGQFAAGGFR